MPRNWGQRSAVISDDADNSPEAHAPVTAISRLRPQFHTLPRCGPMALRVEIPQGPADRRAFSLEHHRCPATEAAR
jgi:hypothetical protein